MSLLVSINRGYVYTCDVIIMKHGFFTVLPAPTNVTSISQSTSITTTWTQPEGDVASSYEITYSYQGPCPSVLQSETVSISGSRRQFTAVDLHEFSNYTITIIASNGAGSSPPVMITTATSPNGIYAVFSIVMSLLIFKNIKSTCVRFLLL